MRINSILEVSEANGPGKRGVVWVQGCACQLYFAGKRGAFKKNYKRRDGRAV